MQNYTKAEKIALKAIADALECKLVFRMSERFPNQDMPAQFKCRGYNLQNSKGWGVKDTHWNFRVDMRARLPSVRTSIRSWRDIVPKKQQETFISEVNISRAKSPENISKEIKRRLTPSALLYHEKFEAFQVETDLKLKEFKKRIKTLEKRYGVRFGLPYSSGTLNVDAVKLDTELRAYTYWETDRITLKLHASGFSVESFYCSNDNTEAFLKALKVKGNESGA